MMKVDFTFPIAKNSFLKKSWNKYPKTKYLDFYEQHKVTVVDYINSQLKKGKKVQYFSIDKISEVLADYGFDKSEVMEIANYCKEE